jgi:hypothetical protein
MYRHTTVLTTGAIVIAAVVTVALYSTIVANAQSTNMTKNMTGSNMSKTMNMTAGGGNMTKSTHHHRTTEITRAPGL